jgi:hypothetical protein
VDVEHLECLKTGDACKADVASGDGLGTSNNCIFGDGKARITHSTDFLKNYRHMLNNREEGNNVEDRKRKTPMFVI